MVGQTPYQIKSMDHRLWYGSYKYCPHHIKSILIGSLTAMNTLISGSNDLSETMSKNIPLGAVPVVESHAYLDFICNIIRGSFNQLEQHCDHASKNVISRTSILMTSLVP